MEWRYVDHIVHTQAASALEENNEEINTTPFVLCPSLFIDDLPVRE